MNKTRFKIKGGSIAIFFLLMASILLVIKQVQYLSEGPGVPLISPPSSYPFSDLKARELETNNKLWLNGYLGQFFTFKYVGYWTWLALPLFLLFLTRLKKKINWEAGLACVYFLSACLIATRGYFNFRYQLTLIPFTMTFILAFGWDVLSGFDRILRVGAYGFIVLLIIFNIHHYNPTMFQINSFSKDDGLPWVMLNDINKMDIEPDATFLECNAPAFYYYTNKKGLSYNKRILLNKPGILTEKGIDNIFQEEAGVKELNPEKMTRAFDIMKSRYNVKYIIARGLPDYFIELNELTLYGCDLLLTEKAYSLFKLKDHFIHPLFEVKKKLPIYQSDFSKWQGPTTILSRDLAKTSPPLDVLQIRGEFNLTVSPNSEGRVIRVTPVQKDKNGNMLIFLGYWLNHNGIDLKIQPGKDVVFRAVLNLSNRTKIPAKIVIQDETQDWKAETSNIDKSGWNQYVVIKRIRENAKNLILGLYWQPEQETDSLEIKKLEIFII